MYDLSAKYVHISIIIYKRILIDDFPFVFGSFAIFIGNGDTITTKV